METGRWLLRGVFFREEGSGDVLDSEGQAIGVFFLVDVGCLDGEAAFPIPSSSAGPSAGRRRIFNSLDDVGVFRTAFAFTVSSRSANRGEQSGCKGIEFHHGV